jgi:hypothetical protein
MSVSGESTGTSFREFPGGISLHLAEPDLDLFRRPTRVSVDEIDALLGLRPLRDDILGYLLQRALDGQVPVYFAAVLRTLIRPFDAEYDPAKHPVGAAAIEQAMAEWLSGEPAAFRMSGSIPVVTNTFFQTITSRGRRRSVDGQTFCRAGSLATRPCLGRSTLTDRSSNRECEASSASETALQARRTMRANPLVPRR